MGKIVIHQTDEKQTVILTNDAEGIQGVYFGEDGVEKPVGSSGEWTTIGVATGTEPVGKIELTLNAESNDGKRFFSGFSNITGLLIHNMKNVSGGNAGFTDMSSLKICILPDLEATYQLGHFTNSFADDGMLILPKFSGGQYQPLGNNTKLSLVDIGSTATKMMSMTRSKGLKKIILRSTSVVSLNTDALLGTPFESGGTGGEIYVPSNLIESYKAASNWSTYEGYGTITWKALEGSVYENPDWWKAEWEAL